jgi:poly(3-hydroxybutyrate) depolymerase
VFQDISKGLQNMVAAQFATQLLLASNIISSAILPGSKGCGKDLPAAQTPPGGASHQTDFTQSDGTHRTYLIHIPSNYDKNTPVPLIFSFHGQGKNSSEQEGLSQFSNEAWNPNGIAVYPQGIHVYLHYNSSPL